MSPAICSLAKTSVSLGVAVHVFAFALSVAASTTTNTITASTSNISNLPTSVTAIYKIARNGLVVGKVEEKFTRISSNRYKITSITRAEGIAALITSDEFIVTSEGAITRTGLVPSVYTSTRKKDTKRNFVLRFDWANNEIMREFQQDGTSQTETFALAIGTQDRLSAMYQFMRTSPTAKNINVMMSMGKQAEMYQYSKQGEPILSVEAGEFETIHYARETRAGESKAEIWLAKSKYFVPVRIIFEDNRGIKLEQSLLNLAIAD